MKSLISPPCGSGSPHETRDTTHAESRATTNGQRGTRHHLSPRFDTLWRDKPEPTNFRHSHRSPQAVDRTRQEQKSQDPGATGSTGKPLCTAHSLLPPQLHLLLLEVSPVLLVDEHQIEEVFNRELIVDVLERWCQVFEPACVQTHTSVGARERA